MSLKFLIIIPAHNEEEFLPYCLLSLEEQSYRDFNVVVVNDGSLDGTSQVAHEFAKKDSRFFALDLPSSKHEPGAKVVRSFYKGLESTDSKEFDVLCKFDADIVFPRDYLNEIRQLYQSDHSIGMASGLVRITEGAIDLSKIMDFEKESSGWKYENLSDPSHVRGPIKSYLRECFEAMGGIRPTLGWDNIDGLLAQKNGYQVKTIKSLWVKHLRPTAERYEKQKAQKLGRYFYNLGLSFPLAVISGAKASIRSGGLPHFFTLLGAFLKSKGQREITAEEIKYIRQLRWKQFFNKLKW